MMLRTMLMAAACWLAAATPAMAQTGGCGAGLAIEIDASDFASDGRGDAAQSAFIDRMKAVTGARFREAAAALCAEGGLAAADLQPFTRVMIQNGSGDTDVTLYVDREVYGAKTLVLQYLFDGGAAAPPVADVKAGLACWRKPDGPGCSG